MSSCRISVTEVYQSGGSGPGAGNWGCEVDAGTGSQYVQAITTDGDGRVTATARGISASVNGSIITFVPLADATTPATYSGGAQALFGWRCGSSADGTTVPLKFLPGSCRG